MEQRAPLNTGLPALPENFTPPAGTEVARTNGVEVMSLRDMVGYVNPTLLDTGHAQNVADKLNPTEFVEVNAAPPEDHLLYGRRAMAMGVMHGTVPPELDPAGAHATYINYLDRQRESGPRFPAPQPEAPREIEEVLAEQPLEADVVRMPQTLGSEDTVETSMEALRETLAREQEQDGYDPEKTLGLPIPSEAMLARLRAEAYGGVPEGAVEATTEMAAFDPGAYETPQDSSRTIPAPGFTTSGRALEMPERPAFPPTPPRRHRRGTPPAGHGRGHRREKRLGRLAGVATLIAVGGAAILGAFNNMEYGSDSQQASPERSVVTEAPRYPTDAPSTGHTEKPKATPTSEVSRIPEIPLNDTRTKAPTKPSTPTPKASASATKRPTTPAPTRTATTPRPTPSGSASTPAPTPRPTETVTPTPTPTATETTPAPTPTETTTTPASTETPVATLLSVGVVNAAEQTAPAPEAAKQSRLQRATALLGRLAFGRF